VTGACSSEPPVAPVWTAPPARLVSLSHDHKLGNERSSVPYPPVAAVVTPNGRFVAFESMADNLVPDDTSRSHEFQEIFVRDMRGRTTERINVSSSENQANQGTRAGDDYYLVYPNTILGGISDNGRYVVFATTSNNLVPGDTNRAWDVFVRDRRAAKTKRVSIASDGAEGNEDSFNPVISGDGKIVAFASGASNLVSDDTNRHPDVFAHYLATGETVRVSVSSTGEEARLPKGAHCFEGSASPSISSDGAFVAFSSSATNLVEDDTNGLADVFVRDINAGETRRVSISSDGAQAEPIEIDQETYGGSSSVSLSGDGSVVMFGTMAPNLVDDDTNKLADMFVHDMKTGETERVSVSSEGRQVTGCTDDECLHEEGSAGGSISFDGRVVAFTSGGDLGGRDADHPYGTDHDVFIRDRATDRTILANHRYTGEPAAPGNLYGPSLSTNGRWLVFGADDRRLVRETRGVEAFGWVFLQRLPPSLFD
jgi:Tol biopolymer transport system component